MKINKNFSPNEMLKKILKVKENNIVDSICFYLKIKKYFFWRQNNNPIFTGLYKAGGRVYRPKGTPVYRSLPKYGKKGIPDIILIKKRVVFIPKKDFVNDMSEDIIKKYFDIICIGEFVGIETKTNVGVLSEEQKDFKENSPGVFIRARSTRDIEEAGL